MEIGKGINKDLNIIIRKENHYHPIVLQNRYIPSKNFTMITKIRSEALRKEGGITHHDFTLISSGSSQ